MFYRMSDQSVAATYVLLSYFSYQRSVELKGQGLLGFIG